MTADEFIFLALGLILGGAAGAALIMVLRAGPGAAREVRVTVAQDAIPRRSATLAEDAFGASMTEPAPAGPGDRRMQTQDPPPGTPDRRTPVRTGDLLRPAAALRPTMPGQPVNDPPVSSPARSRPRRGGGLIGLRVSGGPDPVLAAFHAGDRSSASRPAAVGTATAVLDDDRRASATADDAVASVPSPPLAAAGPCSDARRHADERCAMAGRAREGASAAEEGLRQAQRAYDDHETRAEDAARLADAREVRAAKDAAQATFRAARDHAARTDDVEAAARAWLAEINRVNVESRGAAVIVQREREAARVLALQLERLALEADAARISAETAEAGCVSARQALADCEEQGAAAADQPAALSWGPPGVFTEEVSAVGALSTDGTPRIFRLLRGDRAALTEVVAAMAGDDTDERRRWQLAVTDLVDAVLSDTIAASVLQFPDEHPFWGPFTLTQDREIAAALSSLGYRFDGLGGWGDGRVPSQRDLSLAVGYAGLDPLRIRHWPSETEMAELFRDVTVAADEHLASVAGDLTLGEMVAMLGRRADGLAEVWNQWGRLRPLLLEER